MLLAADSLPGRPLAHRIDRRRRPASGKSAIRRVKRASRVRLQGWRRGRAATDR
ncbi:MAG: hypothetical protein ACRDD1_19990 [Planctomycetia bacterium]